MSSVASSVANLAHRYAIALLDLADEQSQVDTVLIDLDALKHLIDSSADLKKLVNSPVISNRLQIEAMSAILATMGTSILTKNFVGTVAKNGRLNCLLEMITAYKTSLANRRGETSAEVISAQELTTGEFKLISAALNKCTGKKVSVDAKVDKSLLGGLIVRIGSQMVDSSLKTKLQQLGLTMKGVG